MATHSTLGSGATARPRRPLAGTRAAARVALVLALSLTLTPATAAHAAAGTTAQIGGTVMEQNDVGVEYAEVTLEGPGGSREEFRADRRGVFSHAVPAGPHRLCAYSSFRNDLGMACLDVDVPRSGLTGLTIELPPLRRISGRLTNDAGQGADHVSVQALVRTADESWREDEATITGDDGAFSMYVETGTYRLCFRGKPFIDQCWNGKGGGAPLSDAADVTVSADEVGGIDAVLGRVASVIRGHATWAGTDLPAVGAYVQLYDGDSDVNSRPGGDAARVAADGSFALTVLPGDWHLGAQHGELVWPAGQQDRPFTATTGIRVAANTVAQDLDLVVRPAAAISGQVVSQIDGGTDVAGLVEFYRSRAGASSKPVDSVEVRLSRDGALTRDNFAAPLTTGRYKVALRDHEGDRHWYGGPTFGSARDVVVRDGSPPASVDFSLGTDAAPPTPGAARIDGVPDVGSTLRVDPGEWPDGTTFEYRWSDGVESTDPTRVITARDYQMVVPHLSVEVGATVPGWAPIRVETPEVDLPSQTPTLRGSLRPTTLPEVDLPRRGYLVVGDRASATTGAWNPAGATFTYSWLGEGKARSGPTYEVDAADALDEVSVRVYAAKPGFLGFWAESNSSGRIGLGLLRTGTPRVSGTPRVGSVLRLAGTASTPKAGLRVQWLRQGRATRGATRATYRVSRGDRGKALAARATWVKAGYVRATKTSRAVRPR